MTMPKIVMLGTDWVLWSGALALAVAVWHVRRHAHLRAHWKRVWREPAAMSASVLLGFFLLVTLVDSVHFRRALPPAPGVPADRVFYATQTESLLDVLLARQVAARESSYSRPLAVHALNMETVTVEGRTERRPARLAHAGQALQDPERDWAGDVLRRGAAGLAGGLALWALCAAALAWRLDRHRPAAERRGIAAMLRDLAADRSELPWRAGLITLGVLLALGGVAVGLSTHYHVLGTDRSGSDVLYQSLKSVRTAFVIGVLSTVATLPLAMTLGILAGWFRGWVDEVVQYLYTVMSSVPNVLLIAACVLMVQVFLDKHPELFETGLERADLKIFLLCLILGLTGWAGLCRLLRAETLKLRELEFVQAATAFGVPHLRIMGRHILPNVMHLVLINTVLDFSALVLYEAVLSYVGVGVDPSMSSFGGMINLGRDEMARDPLVWWVFGSAFVFMVTLVLAANLFADGVRDAFDPKARSQRPRWLGKGVTP